MNFAIIYSAFNFDRNKIDPFQYLMFSFFWVLSDAGAKHLVGGQKEVEERSRVAEMI